MTAVRAVLPHRDGTLTEDVPSNDDPDLVRPLPGAAGAPGAQVSSAATGNPTKTTAGTPG